MRAFASALTIASAVLGVFCVGCLWLWPPVVSRLVEAAWLGGSIAGGAVVFWLASAVLGAPERVALLRLGDRRRKRVL